MSFHNLDPAFTPLQILTIKWTRSISLGHGEDPNLW